MARVERKVDPKAETKNIKKIIRDVVFDVDIPGVIFSQKLASFKCQ